MIESTPLPVDDRRRPRAARPLAFPSGDKLFCKPLDQTCRASPSPSPTRVCVERSSSARCLSAKKAKARGRARRRTGDPAGSPRRARATRAQVSASCSAAPRRAPRPVLCVPAQLSWRLTRSPSCRAGAASTWCPSAARTPRLLAVPPGPSGSAVHRCSRALSRAPASVTEPSPGVRLRLRDPYRLRVPCGPRALRGPLLPSSERNGNRFGVQEPAPRRVGPGATQRMVGERVAWASGRRRGERREAVDSRCGSLGSP